jgi:hypothetical protein
MFTYGSVRRSGVFFSHSPLSYPFHYFLFRVIPLFQLSPDPFSCPPVVLEGAKNFVFVCGPRSKSCVAQQSAEVVGNCVQAVHSKFCLGSYSGR